MNRVGRFRRNRWKDDGVGEDTRRETGVVSEFCAVRSAQKINRTIRKQIASHIRNIVVVRIVRISHSFTRASHPSHGHPNLPWMRFLALLGTEQKAGSVSRRFLHHLEVVSRRRGHFSIGRKVCGITREEHSSKDIPPDPQNPPPYTIR